MSCKHVVNMKPQLNTCARLCTPSPTYAYTHIHARTHRQRWAYQFGFSLLARKTDSSFMDAYWVHVRQWLRIAMCLSWGLSHDSSSNWILGTFKMLPCPIEGRWLLSWGRTDYIRIVYRTAFSLGWFKRQVILTCGWRFTNGCKYLIIKHTMTLLNADEDVQMAQDVGRLYRSWPDALTC